MRPENEDTKLDVDDEAYFDDTERKPRHRFDEKLLQAPISVLSRRISQTVANQVWLCGKSQLHTQLVFPDTIE